MMFEQAVLRPAPVRGWAVTLSFMGELTVVGCLLAIPLIWPQLLPRRELVSWITAPLPPPPPIRDGAIPHVRPAKPGIHSSAIWYTPVPVPQVVPALDEPPVDAPGAVGGRESGTPNPLLGPILDSVVRRDTPKRPMEAAPASAPKSAPAPIQQVRVSGALQAARLIHRVEPVYPALARQARISGTVELAGVIGTNGQIRELRVVSGPALLVQPALDAVRQWIYQPTLLGGQPVEVITSISVIFRLN
jgi:periplasmic protein TonB